MAPHDLAARGRERPRRRHRRRTLRVRVEIAVGARRSTGWATTLGAGGLFVATDTPLPAGAKLAARFQLPGSATVHEIAGRVAWTRPPGAAGSYSAGMGVAFTDRAAAARLARELEKLD
jgi:uncharacterized protein (TIGR02266 family)